MIGNKVAIVGSDIRIGVIQSHTKTLINVKVDGIDKIVKVRKTNNMVQGGEIALMTNFDDDNSARAFAKLKLMNQESKNSKELLITFILNSSDNQIIQKMKDVVNPPVVSEEPIKPAKKPAVEVKKI